MAHTIAQLERDIEALLSTLSDPEPFLNELGQRLRESFKYGFREQKDPNNNPWKPSQRALDQGGQTLVDTARLRNSIGFAVSKQSATHQTLQEGTNVIYAAVHNEGLDGIVRIKAHTRRIAMAFGKPIKPKTIQVKAHDRKANNEKREFIGFGQRQIHPMKKALNYWAGEAVRDFK